MNYYQNDIRNVKGDTFSCALRVEDLGQNLDEIYFTCREGSNDNSTVLFQCTLGNGISLVSYDAAKDIREYAIRVSPNKTKNLQAGTYFYDERVKVNNDIFTIMRGRFIIEQNSSII